MCYDTQNMRMEMKLLLAGLFGALTMSAETIVLEGFTLIDGTGRAAQAGRTGQKFFT